LKRQGPQFYDDFGLMSGISETIPILPQLAGRKNDAVSRQGVAVRHTPHHLSGIHGRFALALTTLIVSAFGQQAGAKAIVASAHTTTLAANCWITGPGRVEDSPIRVCRGKATLVVLVNQSAQRETVSVGHNRIEAAKEPAARSSFGPFNRALPGIEWRIAGGNPIAIIQRWRIANSDAKPMLVVTRLPPGQVCPVAYVDAAANPNPDELARQAADQIARDFKCGTDHAKVFGAAGRTAELTASPR
jgi:hypothetical protein